MSSSPLIAICGTTGVGKSKLAIELALKLSKDPGINGWHGARIINADSMQVYRGLDVLTNKVPLHQRHGVEHALMDFKNPGEQYVVGEWVQDTIQEISAAHKECQIPIVVGGTGYWMQHLLFPNRLASDPDPSSSAKTPVVMSEELKGSLANLPPELLDLFNMLPDTPPSASDDPKAAFALHALLSALDPAVANRWHWKDTRKVLRSLSIMRDTGRTPGEIFSEQSRTAVRPRYRALCFWLYASPDVLNVRLDERVDAMLAQGVLNEIQELRRLVTSPSPNSSAPDMDYTTGIYQCIGYREFDSYLNETSPSEKSYQNAVEAMKLSTRKYAKRQISWIRNKLLPAIYASVDPTVPRSDDPAAFLLDATDIDRWNHDVQDTAIDITERFLRHDSLPDPPSLSDHANEMLSIALKPTSPVAVLDAQRKVICPTCTLDDQQPVMIDKKNWAAHAKTKVHKRLASPRDPRRPKHR